MEDFILQGHVLDHVVYEAFVAILDSLEDSSHSGVGGLDDLVESLSVDFDVPLLVHALTLVQLQLVLLFAMHIRVSFSRLVSSIWTLGTLV